MKKELQKHDYFDADFYKSICSILVDARTRVYSNIQNEMVLAYWQIGK